MLSNLAGRCVKLLIEKGKAAEQNMHSTFPRWLTDDSQLYCSAAVITRYVRLNCHLSSAVHMVCSLALGVCVELWKQNYIYIYMQAEKALVSDHDFKNIPRSRAIHKSFVHLHHFAQGTHIIIHNKEFMSTQIWLGSSKLTPFSSCPS
jgi:hypothetical protein